MRLFVDYSEHLEDIYSCFSAGCNFAAMACSATFQDLAEMRIVIDLDKYRSVEAVPSVFDSTYSLLVAERQTSIGLPVRKVLGVYHKDVTNALVKAICLAWSNSEPVFVVSEFLKGYKNEETAREETGDSEKSFNFFSKATSKDIEDTYLYKFGKQAFDVLDETAENLVNLVDKAFDHIDDAFAELRVNIDNVFGKDLSDEECSPDSEDESADTGTESETEFNSNGKAETEVSAVSDVCDNPETVKSEDDIDSDLSEDIKSSDVFVDSKPSETEKAEDSAKVEDSAKDTKTAETERKGRRRK